MNANRKTSRKTHGQPEPEPPNPGPPNSGWPGSGLPDSGSHRLVGAPLLADWGVSSLDRVADAGAGAGSRAAAALGRDIPALLSPLLLPDCRYQGMHDRGAGAGTAGTVRGQSHLLS